MFLQWTRKSIKSLFGYGKNMFRQPAENSSADGQKFSAPFVNFPRSLFSPTLRYSEGTENFLNFEFFEFRRIKKMMKFSSEIYTFIFLEGNKTKIGGWKWNRWYSWVSCWGDFELCFFVGCFFYSSENNFCYRFLVDISCIKKSNLDVLCFFFISFFVIFKVTPNFSLLYTTRF